MSDYELPELPSDEELGIAGMGEDEAKERKPSGRRKKAAPPGPPPPPQSGDGGGEGPGAPPAPEEPGRPWRGPATLVALVVLAWASTWGRALPGPQPATAPDTTFSSARAMVELVELARRAHPPGSPEHARVREHLVNRLRGLGLDPEIQTTTSVSPRRGPDVLAATVRNIVARMPGTASTGAVLLAAHYDGRTLSPAAADDGSGVAAILETLRAIRAGAPLRNDVVVLISDGEELGLLGARAFVREHPWMQDVSVVLNVEMRGGGGPSIMFQTGRDNGWIVGAFKAGVPTPFANSISYEVYQRLPNDTDFTPFLEAGKQGLNFAGIGRAHVYHQVFDTPENFQDATLQSHGVNLLGAVRELGSRDLTEVNGPDRVFFRLPLLGLVTYGTLWPPVLGVLLFLMAGLAFVLGRRKGMGGGGVVLGLVLALVAVAGSAAAGWGLFRWVRRFHPEYGHLQGSAFHSEGWYVLAMVAAAFTLVTLLFGVARKRISLVGLTLGALILPLLAAVFLSFAAPLAAMNLQWPVLAGLVAAAGVAGVSGTRRPGLLRFVLLLVLAVPVVVLMTPLIDLVWQAMSVAAAPVLAGLAAVGLLLLLPLLDVLTQPNRWWAPLTGLVLGAVFLGVGLLHARPTADRPTPTTLLYALDHQSGSARWATRPGDPGQAWAQGRVGSLEEESNLATFLMAPPPRPGDTAGAPADSLGPEETVRRAGPAPYLTGPAPTVDAPAPEVFLVPRDSATAPATDAGGIRIGVRSRVGAEVVGVRAAPGSRVSWLAVNGRALERGGAEVRSVTHWGTPEGGAVLLDLEAPTGPEGVRLVVLEQLLRPSELVSQETFRRPPDMVADVGGLSDRALLRSVVRVGPDPEGGMEVVPVTGALAADTAAAPDTAGAPADTAGAPADTAAADTTAAPDTTGTPDTAAADTTGRPDTTAAPDTGRSVPDTAAADTTAAPDTSATPDTTGRPDTTAAPDTTAGSGATPRRRPTPPQRRTRRQPPALP